MSYMGAICPQSNLDCLSNSRDLPAAEEENRNMEPFTTTPTPTILDEAKAMVYGARNESYGHPRNNFAATAALWNAYLFQGARSGPITEEDVAMLMVLLKVARLENGYHRDSAVDLAGYAATYERLQEADPELQALLDRLADEPSPFLPWPRLGSESWDTLVDVPWDTKVVDKDGDVYEWHGQTEHWYWVDRGRYLDEDDLEMSAMFAPFTAVSGDSDVTTTAAL